MGQNGNVTRMSPRQKGGLLKVLGSRRSLLKYMQRTNLEGYRALIKELGIRK